MLQAAVVGDYCQLFPPTSQCTANDIKDPSTTVKCTNCTSFNPETGTPQCTENDNIEVAITSFLVVSCICPVLLAEGVWRAGVDYNCRFPSRRPENN